MFLNNLGIHIKNDINKIDHMMKDIDDASKDNCSYVQFFVNTNPKYKNVYKKISKHLLIRKIKPIIHLSYTINIAKSWDKYSWWIQQFIDEIKIAHMLNAYAVVIHTGKQMQLSVAEAYNNMFSTLLYVNKKTLKYKSIKILIETSSGNSSEMCSDIHDLAYFYNKLSFNKRFGICVDTCHIFAAGYNIRNIKYQEKFFKLFDSLIGIKHIKLLHLNDSKYKLNSRIDRHANIDFGFIGLNALAHFYDYLSVPTVLETPSNGIHHDVSLFE
jgi:deoxyribonuclease-4